LVGDNVLNLKMAAVCGKCTY